MNHPDNKKTTYSEFQAMTLDELLDYQEMLTAMSMLREASERDHKIMESHNKGGR